MQRTGWIVLLVVAAAVGLFVGDRLGARRAETELLSVSLVHQLDRAGLCARLARLDDAADRDDIRRLVNECLASSLTRADRLMASGVGIEQPVPNILEGVREALAYARDRSGSDELREIAEAVEARL